MVWVIPKMSAPAAGKLKDAEIPRCHICGSKMTIARTGPEGTTYACDESIKDERDKGNRPKGLVWSKADEHYWNSRRIFTDDSAMRLYYLEQSFLKLPVAAASESSAELQAKTEHAYEAGIDEGRKEGAAIMAEMRAEIARTSTTNFPSYRFKKWVLSLFDAKEGQKP